MSRSKVKIKQNHSAFVKRNVQKSKSVNGLGPNDRTYDIKPAKLIKRIGAAEVRDPVNEGSDDIQSSYTK